MAGENTPKTPMGGVKAFNCRNCGGQVNLLAPGQSLTAACSHCGAVADLTDDNFRILSAVKAKLTRNPLFEIGSKAQFEGNTWQLIGFMLREVEQYNFVWEEYLLFNPRYGFRFLANAYGHWSWIKMIHDLPIREFNQPAPRYDGKSFSKLTAGAARVRYVLGEFYWQVSVNDLAETTDFVAPPYMLSRELEAGGMIWSLGEYVEPQVVANAFNVSRSILPQKIRVGANQPNKPKINLRSILPFWIGGMLATLLLGVIFANTAPKAVVWSKTYNYPIVDDTISDEFVLTKGIDNVEIEVQALSGLENHWMELSGILHDTTTNLNYDFILPVEYYYGYDDGAWSEGSKDQSIVLNEIPAGTYEFISSIASDTAGTVSITISRGVPVYSNWIMVMVILSIVPLFLFFRGRAFEKRRND